MGFNNRSKPGAKKEYPPSPGSLWRKKSNKGVKYITLSLDPAVLATAVLGDDGKIQLVGFENDNENKIPGKSPDFFLKLSEPFQKGGNSKPAARRPAPAPKAAESEEDESDAEESEDDDGEEFPF